MGGGKIIPCMAPCEMRHLRARGVRLLVFESLVLRSSARISSRKMLAGGSFVRMRRTIGSVAIWRSTDTVGVPIGGGIEWIRLKP